MFPVISTLQQRRDKIIGFVEAGEPEIALVLAAADFSELYGGSSLRSVISQLRI